MGGDFEDAFRSHHHPEKTADGPFVRVMALHAPADREWLADRDEVDALRVAVPEKPRRPWPLAPRRRRWPLYGFPWAP